MSANLLPKDSTTAFEAAIADAMARISAIPVPIATIKRAQETDPRVLTALGWEWSVNEWQSLWADQRKRDVVDASPAVHRVLGTAGAMRRAIDALGYKIVMQEWFQYAGDPYCFRISFDLDEQTLTIPDYLMIQRVALDTKNVRSFFEGFAAARRQAGKITYGFGHGGDLERVFQPPEPPIYRFDGWIGAGIGQHPIFVSSTFEPAGTVDYPHHIAVEIMFANGEQGLWLDPSDLSTLFQDAAGTTPVTTDGDPVGLILDKSGNGNHASQVTLASRPTYRTDGTLHWLEFDGVDDWLVTTSVLPINATDEVTLCIGQKHLVNSPDGVVAELSPTRATNTNAFTFFSPSNVNRYSWVARGSGGASNSANTTSASYTAPHTGVLTGLAKISPSNTVLRVNGSQAGQGTADTGTGNWGSYQLYIGRRGGATIAWNGRLYGLVVRNALTADPLLSSAETYMAAKTGVSR